MSMFKRFICVCAIIIVPNVLFGQDKFGYMEQPSKALDDAKTAFSAGDYQQAIKLVNIYHTLSEKQDGQQILDNARSCQALSEKALKLELQDDYSAAAKCYEDLLSINPSDTVAKKRYDTISEKAKAKQPSSSKRRIVRSTAVVNTRIKVGDKIHITNNPYDTKYTVCYVDNTGQHGWVMDVGSRTGSWSRLDASNPWRRPSLEEIKRIYPNRFTLGLNDTFWTSTLSKKIANWPFYYTFDFGTGKEKSTDSYKEGYKSIFIRNF